jgi:hypothetical protein
MNTTLNSRSNNVAKTGLVDNFISKAKDKMNKMDNNNLRIYLIIMVPVLFFVIYLLYKYNFTSRSTTVIANMGYKSNIALAPIPQCYQVDITQQFKLCDYYINSSFMTPCVGNQHYDYVALDMITEVIQSGARYIQIPICESDVSIQALPVVGTAVYGQRVITSLNTLEIKAVLKSIRATAFKINNKQINYPLIIHLVLNTTNSFTLGVLADNISEVLSDILVDVSRYQKTPIFLEKLCNLLGKIVIFATPEYSGTRLEPYIVPINKLFEIYHFGDLGELSMPNNDIYKNSYNQKLSSKQQTQSNLNFKAKYPTIDYVAKNADTIPAIIPTITA